MKKIKLTCIIDDDDIYVYAIKRLIDIQKLCDNILVFKDGREALDYFKNNIKNIDLIPDIILLDVKMPIMDGWQFVNEYIKLEIDKIKDVAMYMVSSSIDPRDIKRADAIPQIEKYLFKPITFDELKEIFNPLF